MTDVTRLGESDVGLRTRLCLSEPQKFIKGILCIVEGRNPMTVELAMDIDYTPVTQLSDVNSPTNALRRLRMTLRPIRSIIDGVYDYHA